MTPLDPDSVLVDGPWRHRLVSANGCRFHVAEAGPDVGPLVVLLHGFPHFWWAWHRQLEHLSARGHRVAALDLRGYGASDKPPRGYDTMTSAADVAGVIRSLGESEAVVVGHGWGAWTAWSMPSLQPRTTRAVAALSMGHPLRMRASLVARRRLRDARTLMWAQLPVLPERSLQRRSTVPSLLRRWSGTPGWPSPEEAERYAAAMRIPFVAHSAMEYYRWVVRSVPRPDGVRFARAVRDPVRVPVLQVHGGADRLILPSRVRGSARHVEGSYRWEVLDGVGHYPAQEAPERVNDLLTSWLQSL